VTPHACPPTTAAALLLVVALATWLNALGSGDAPHVTTVDCTRAVMLDDHLKCGDESPRDIATLCGPDHPLAARPIAAGDRIATARLCAGDVAARARMSTADLRTLAVPIDVNHAPLEELRSLPGIGPTLAERVVAGRPYASADDLDRVRGIGPKTIARLRSRLRIESPRGGVGPR
jgi:competence protein ComEA